MVVIELEYEINQKIDICFDLSRSIDVHLASTDGTGERAVGGVTSGLICMGETVTWSAVHFGIRQKLTSKITEFNKPNKFSDTMLKDAFKYFHHDHYFEEVNGVTIIKDKIQIEAPFGFIGRLVERLILKDYMTKFITKRNQVKKQIAESEEWKKYIES